MRQWHCDHGVDGRLSRRCPQVRHALTLCAAAIVVALMWPHGPETLAAETKVAELTRLRTQALRLRTGQRKYKEAAAIMDGVLPQSRELGDARVHSFCLLEHAYNCCYCNRYEDALKSARECVELYGEADQRLLYSVSLCDYFAVYALRGLKRKDEAAEAVLAMFEKYRGNPWARKGLQYAMIAWPQWGPELLGWERAIEVHRENLVNIFIRPQTDAPGKGRYQRGMVEMLLRARRAADALGEAKLYFYVAPLDDKSSQEAIRWLSTAFKAHDGTIHRLNRFLSYQRYGPAGPDGQVGTDDDLENVLATTEVPSTPERDQMLQQILDRQPDDYRGHRLRGYVYLFMDKPKEAVAESKLAYQLCPVEEKAVQQAVDDAATGLRASHGTALAAQEFLEFQQHGPNGPDGKKGTDDDINDPLKEF